MPFIEHFIDVFFEYDIQPSGSCEVGDDGFNCVSGDNSNPPYKFRTEHVDVPLVGYYAAIRVFELVDVTETGPDPNWEPDPDIEGEQFAPIIILDQFTRKDYVSYELVSSDFYNVDPDPPIFKFPPDDDDYIYAELRSYAPEEWAKSSIVDGTLYEALTIFYDNSYSYIDRLTKPTVWDLQGDPPDYTTKSLEFKNQPFDPSETPPVYPVDAYCEINIDETDPRIVSYFFSNTIRILMGYTAGTTKTETVSITHSVRQPKDGWGYIVKEAVLNSYYQASYYPYLNRNYVDGGIYE
jgi:hypothetical protein